MSLFHVLLVFLLCCLELSRGFLPRVQYRKMASSGFAMREEVACFAQLRRNDRGRTDRPKREKGPPMNQDISADPLRVVLAKAGEADEQLGVLSRSDALDKAAEAGLDLVMISAKVRPGATNAASKISRCNVGIREECADPPVVKIVDYGKFKYAEEKKKKEQAKKSKQSEMKELKMSYKIDVHDYDVRLKNAVKFLDQGSGEHVSRYDHALEASIHAHLCPRTMKLTFLLLRPRKGLVEEVCGGPCHGWNCRGRTEAGGESIDDDRFAEDGHQETGVREPRGKMN
eukprot:scaffold7069_cov368-Pinguiococcus_pyrenoidosus.AAC.1